MKSGAKIIFGFLIFFFGFFFWGKNGLAAEEELVITGVVKPKPSDIEFSFSSSVPGGSTLLEEQQVNFTISYRSALMGTESFRIEAGWEEGQLNGGSEYVDVFDYVLGSATTSDGGTVPVIDLVNRTIVWDIESLVPSESTHDVLFSLKVKSSLPTDVDISTSVYSQGKIFNTYWPEERINYSVEATIEPTSTPTATPTPTAVPTVTSIPGPTSTPTAGPTSTPGVAATSTPGPTVTSTATPTPTVSPVPLSFKKIEIKEIGAEFVKIYVETSRPTTLDLWYGEEKEKLFEKISKENYKTEHLIEIKDLEVNKRYYFKITIKAEDGEEKSSDLFVVRTARSEALVKISKDRLMLSASGIPLTRGRVKEVGFPMEKEILISIRVENPELVRKIMAKFENSQVLGIASSVMAQPPIKEARLLETLPGVFSGDLLGPKTKGNYRLVLNIEDVYGGFFTEVMPQELFVSRPIRLVYRESGRPVEGAEVNVLHFDEKQSLFVQMAEGFSFPVFSDEKGEIDIALPVGLYKFKISSIRHKEEEFLVDLRGGVVFYPELRLETLPGWRAVLAYYSHSVRDVWHYISSELDSFFLSHRVRDLSLILTFLISLILALEIVAMKLGLKTICLGCWGLKKVKRWQKARLGLGEDEKRVQVRIHPSRKLLWGAKVYFFDKTGKCIFKEKTGPDGEFDLKKSSLDTAVFPIKVSVHHKGYYQYSIDLSEEALKTEVIELSVEKEKKSRTWPDIRDWLLKWLWEFTKSLLVLYPLLATYFLYKRLGWRETWLMFLITWVMVMVGIKRIRVDIESRSRT